MEKETLEDAAKNKYPIENTGAMFMPNLHEVSNIFRQEGFIAGAKCQQERSYSEEDLREAFKQSRQCKIFEKDMPPVHNEFEDWFEQFKKK